MSVQGRFKRPVSFEDLVTGQEFARPPRNLPAKWLVEKVLIRVRARRLLHGLLADFLKSGGQVARALTDFPAIQIVLNQAHWQVSKTCMTGAASQPP